MIFDGDAATDGNTEMLTELAPDLVPADARIVYAASSRAEGDEPRTSTVIYRSKVGGFWEVTHEGDAATVRTVSLSPGYVRGLLMAAVDNMLGVPVVSHG